MFRSLALLQPKRRPSLSSHRRSLEYQTIEPRRVLALYIVDTIADTANSSPDGSLSLREAIIAANTNAAFGDAVAGSSTEIDEIRFHPSLAGQTIVLSRGQLTITDRLMIRGGNLDLTIDANNSSRIFAVVSTDATIAGLTLTGGRAHVGGAVAVFGQGQSLLFKLNLTANVATGAGGGALYNAESNVYVTDCVFENNSATNPSSAGGAIRTIDGTVAMNGGQIRANTAQRAGGGVSIVHGRFFATNVVVGGFEPGDGNIAGSGSGGVLGFGGGLHVTGTLGTRVAVRASTFAGNQADVSGGALWNQLGSTLIIRDDSEVTSNRANGNGAADGGGGVFNRGRLVVMNSSIRGNAAFGGQASGGGIYSAAGQLIATNATVAANVAVRSGGGVEIVDGFARFTNSSLGGSNTDQGNRAGSGGAANPGSGGGLHVRGTNGTRVVFEGGLIANNRAAYQGGGLWVNSGSEIVIRDGMSIFNNGTDESFSMGGGIYVRGRLQVNDATINSNTAGDRGGGVFVESTGKAVFESTTISANIGGSFGGGVYNRGFTRLLSSTVNANVVSQNGGGIFREPTSTTLLEDSLVLANLPNDFNM